MGQTLLCRPQKSSLSAMEFFRDAHTLMIYEAKRMAYTCILNGGLSFGLAGRGPHPSYTEILRGEGVEKIGEGNLV